MAAQRARLKQSVESRAVRNLRSMGIVSPFWDLEMEERGNGEHGDAVVKEIYDSMPNRFEGRRLLKKENELKLIS